jgi:hypothetical protein
MRPRSRSQPALTASNTAALLGNELVHSAKPARYCSAGLVGEFVAKGSIELAWRPDSYLDHRENMDPVAKTSVQRLLHLTGAGV